MKASKKSWWRPRGPVRFKGICRDAEILGRSRIHLYYVLCGTRPGPGLLARYHALKAQQATEKATEKAA